MYMAAVFWSSHNSKSYIRRSARRHTVLHTLANAFNLLAPGTKNSVTGGSSPLYLSIIFSNNVISSVFIAKLCEFLLSEIANRQFRPIRVP